MTRLGGRGRERVGIGRRECEGGGEGGRKEEGGGGEGGRKSEGKHDGG